MSRKNKIIVSIVGISIISLALIGLTYGYYLTRIQGNTNNKSISISTVNLELTYSDNSDVITGTNIVPGTTLGTKTFTVTNSGNNNVDSYSVGLVNVINTFTRLDDIKYTVTCSSSVTGKTCNGVSESTFPNENSYIIENQINKNEVQTYVIEVEYKEMNVDQSVDMGKTLEAKIDIFDTKSLTIKGTVTNSSENDYVVIHSKEQTSEIIDGKYKFIGIEPDSHKITIKNRKTTATKQTTLNVSKGTPSASGSNITYNDEKNVAAADITITGSTVTIDVNKISDGKIFLKDIIIDSAKLGGAGRTILGTTVTEFTSVSEENERVLNNAPDDYGTSYYYRGNVTDNYVDFAGFIWRIIRINGDDSIRMILNDTLDVTKRKNLDIYAGNKSAYNNTDDSTSFAEKEGYVGYMFGDLATSSVGYDNINDSSIKIEIDSFYEKYLENNEYNYSKYLSDNVFCNDKNGEGPSGMIYAYQARNRLLSSKVVPTFECAKNVENNYSRFTVSKITVNGVEMNGDLKYPIALMTADEVVYAGGFPGTSNNNYYLYSGNEWFTMTPSAYYNDGPSKINAMFINGVILDYRSAATVRSKSGVRPVINLKNDIQLSTGDGTKENPYVIKTD